LSARQPLVLLLEDIHWADEASLRLLAVVSRRVRERAVLVLATAREEELGDASLTWRTVQELAREPHVTQLIVSPLSQEDTMRLVRTLTRPGNAAEIARLEEQVWALSEGNPFVAVQTTRALQEGTIPPNAETLSMPDRVRELITGCLEHLTGRARDLAAVAAVIGKEFDFPLLQRASGFEGNAAAEWVEELVRRHLLRGAGERFGFAHDRIRVVVYDRLLSPQRKLRHRQVGEAIQEMFAPNLEPHYLALGTHFRLGEVWDKAVDFLRRAGLAAMTRSASREAVACFGQALEALQHLPEDPDSTRLAIDLRCDLQGGYVLLGDLPRMLESLRGAEALATALGDERRLARVYSHIAIHFWWVGQFEAAVDYSRRALTIATTLHDRFLTVLASSRLSLAYLDRGGLSGSDRSRPGVHRGVERRPGSRALRDGFPPRRLRPWIRGLGFGQPRRLLRGSGSRGRGAPDRDRGQPPVQHDAGPRCPGPVANIPGELQ
jgi:hypothetical protein